MAQQQVSYFVAEPMFLRGTLMCYVNSEMQYISLDSHGISDDREVKGKLFGSRLQCSAGRVIRMCCIVKDNIYTLS